MTKLAKNVLGKELKTCCLSPMTGFYRDGCCHTGEEDFGQHLVCAKLTQEFLLFSQDRGNDLITPKPQYQFPGLKPGDKWCVCLSRWLEALKAGYACPIDLEATHEKTLEYIPLAILEEYGV